MTAIPLRANLPGAIGPVVLLGLAGLAAAWLAWKAPIAQYADYHAFADSRELLGLPNAWNVLSNLPFLYVGLVGALLVRRSDSAARLGWIMMFLGVALVALGSGYYHWSPSDDRLVWDRLPMTIGFMGFLVALLTDYVDRRTQRYLLVPALALGLGSVLYWHRTGDLSVYVWVQGFPIVCTLAVLLLYRLPRFEVGCLAANLAFYALAKLGEIYDAELLSLTDGLISGHAVKHLLAAAGAWMIYWMLRGRTVVPTAADRFRPASA